MMLNTLGALIADFHFIRPEWFLALIPIIIILASLRFEKKTQGDWQQIIPKHLLKHLLHEKQGSSSNTALSLLSIIWLLSVIALAGPTWQRVPQPVYEKIEARVYVLDLSYSMYAGDLKPNRMVRARLKLIDLLNAKREGLSALVVFSGDAYVVTPLTNDVNTIVSLIPALEPKIMPNVGSNAKEGVLKALALLSNTKIENGEVILLSDEVLLNDRQNINAMMESSPYKLSILGIGTADGAPIKLPNGQFLKDNSGAIVIPKLNEAELKNLASDNKGRYVTLRKDNKDVRYLHQESNIEASNDSRESQQNFDLWLEAGQWLMFPILLLTAFAFRRGWLLALLVCLNFMPAPDKVYAAGNTIDPVNTNSQKQNKEREKDESSTLSKLSDNWQALWRTGDQRGLSSMQQQNFSKAAKQFNNEDWKASAHYYNGQFAQAAELFNPKKDSTKVKQSYTWYNRGNALARAGDLDGAIKAYDESIALNPDNEDAEFNKNLVEELKKNLPKDKQEQQQNKEKQEQDTQSEENSEKSSEENSKDGSQQDSQQNGDQQDSQGEQSQDSDPQNSDPQQSDSQNKEPQDSDSQQQGSDQESENNQNENSESEASESEESDGEDSENKDLESEEEKSGDQAEDSSEQENNSGKSDEDDAKNSEMSKEALSPLEREKQQALEQWLRQVPDDPSGLMRRKFEIENSRRKNNTNNQQQSW